MIMPYKRESSVEIYSPSRVGGVSDLFDKFSYIMKGYVRMEEEAKALPKATEKDQRLPADFVEESMGFIFGPTSVLGLCLGAQRRDVSHYEVLTSLFGEKRAVIANILQQKGYRTKLE